MYSRFATATKRRAASRRSPDKRPELATSLALVSAEQRPVIVEPRSLPQGRIKHAKQITRIPHGITARSQSGMAASNRRRSKSRHLSLRRLLIYPASSGTITDRAQVTARSATFTFRTRRCGSKRRNQPPAQEPTRMETGGSAFGTEDRGGRPVGVPCGTGEICHAGRLSDADSQEGSGRTRRVYMRAQIGPAPPRRANGLCSRIKSAGGKCFTQVN